MKHLSMTQQEAENNNVVANYPLSGMQQGLLFHSLQDKKSGIYINQVTITLKEEVSCANLKRAINEVIQRHEVLRASLDIAEAKLRIHHSATCDIELHDLTTLDVSQQKQHLKKVLRKDKATDFNYTQVPLLRFKLFKFNNKDYLLVLSYHHALFGGPSALLLIKEVFTLYDAYGSQKEIFLQDPPSYQKYFDYINAADDEKAKAYWRKLLSGYIEPSLLLVPQVLQNTKRAYQQKHIKFSRSLTTRLKQFARANGLTVNIILQAAWGILLTKYTGKKDVVFGVVRELSRALIKDLAGLFINTIPLRIQIDSETTLNSYLSQIRQQYLSLQEAIHLPLPIIQQCSEVEPGIPLFETVLDFKPQAPIAELRKHDESWLKRDLQFDVDTHYPVLVEFFGMGEDLQGRINYAANRFDTATIAHLAKHFQNILLSMLSKDMIYLSQISLLTKIEQQRLLHDWNATAVDFPQTSTLAQLFEEQVQKTPERIALTFADQSLTYAELNQKANQLAHYLISKGVQNETLVALCVERSFDLVIGILGILKAGGAYVPIDPIYPPARIATMLDDCHATVLLTQAKCAQQDKLVSLVHNSDVDVILIDANWGEIATYPATNPSARSSATNLAYVIYTSGSTGKPKGVLIEQRSVINLIFYIKTHLNLSADLNLLSLTAFTFDIFALELYVPILFGGNCILVDKQTMSDNAKLYQYIRQHQVSLLQATPAVWEMLLDVKWSEINAVQVLCGGEALNNRLAKKILSKVPYFWNLYGPSEATIWSTINKVAKINQHSRFIAIGKPVANTQIYILDEELNLQPIGVAGELYISGIGLARGYLNQPQVTQQKFIENPFSDNPYAKLYKTGDIARWLPNGTIEYLSRLDEQIKIHGYRIELAEIEACLLKHPDVAQAAVVVKNIEEEASYLVAYVVASDKSKLIHTDELESFLKQDLPRHMIPKAIMQLENLPLTPNGKINKKALPSISLTTVRSYISPSNVEEQLLVKLWADLLKLNANEISMRANFFELGGHSILAIRLMSCIQNEFNVEISLRDILELSTIEELARKIRQLQTIKNYSSQLLPRSHQHNLPLSYAQQRLWFLNQLQPNNSLYNIFIALQLKGKLDVVALRSAFKDLIMRHESLRTYFEVIDSQPCQIVSAPTEEYIDFRTSSIENEANEQVFEKVYRAAQEPFNLNKGPLLRLNLLQKSAEAILLICMHHIIADGWSLDILARELSLLYSAKLKQQINPLPPLAVQYADFAIWQRDYLKQPQIKKQLDFWIEQLQNLPTLNLPTDFTYPAVATYKGKRINFHFSNETMLRLKSLAQQFNTTLFTALLSAFDILLARYSDQEDIVVGTPVAGRHYPGVANLVGCFVNTLLLRTNLEDNPSFLTLLQRNKMITLQVYANQDIPFEKIVEILRPQRNQHYNPLCKVMLILQNFEQQLVTLEGLEVSRAFEEQNTALLADFDSSKFELSCYFQETENGLEGVFEYSTELFADITIERMVNHFERLIEQILQHPDQPLQNLVFLTAQELKTLLMDWNQTTLEYPQHATIHHLFEEQAARTPQNIAVVFEEQTLTYQQLNERANQLAHVLLANGVKNNSLVAIAVERSLGLVIAILGTLKAGAAYVPIELTYPNARIQYILQDSQVPLVLTCQQANARIADLINHTQLSATLITLDKDIFEAQSYSCINLTQAISSQQYSYVIYTSGTTGNPKGVCNMHQGTVNRIYWMQQQYQLAVSDKVLHKTPISFDVSVWEIFWPLIVGAKLVVATPMVHQEPKALIKLIQEQQITHIHFVPSMLQAFLDEEHVAQCESLRMVFASGEALTADLQNLFFSKLTAGLENLYGPTEASIDVTHWSCIKNLPNQKSVPIGKPIANTQLYILSKYKQLMPLGTIGELYISGDGTAKGYLNLPKLTAKKFTLKPFDDSNTVMYQTGDLARWLPNGNLEYIGRIDNQVKIRGFRVELSEIEAKIRSYKDVEQAAIIVKDELLADKVLVACVVAVNKKITINFNNLQNYLKSLLPYYMVPTHFIQLDELPISSNGKLDKTALAQEAMKSLVNTAAYVAPVNEVQQTLTKVWAEVLQLPLAQISVHDNFFDVGGHSLLALKITAKIKEHWQIDLSLRYLFEAPTIAQLSAVIEEHLPNQTEIAGMTYIARPNSPLVILQAQGTKPPLFLFHPVGGTVFCYMALAKYLGTDYPIYAIQDPGIEYGPDFFSSIEDVASYYINIVREIQPYGPYLLGGGSFGGTVAVEMAYQLEKLGESTLMVAMLDIWALFTDEFRSRTRLITAMKRQYQMTKARLDSERVPSPEPLLDLNWHRMQMWLNYRPPLINNKLTLFKAIELLPEYVPIEEPSNHWYKYSTQPVDVQLVPGNHETMFIEPNVQVVAEKLKACLDKCLEGEDQSLFKPANIITKKDVEAVIG